MGILSYLLLTPLLGALLVMLVPGEYLSRARWVALAMAGITLALSLYVLQQFDSSQAGLQFVESHRWNPRLGTSFSLGLDGFSLPMVVLACLLSLVAMFASSGIDKQVRGYYALLLILLSAMLGVFMAQDWALFYLFWESTLIPLFFLIDRWGGKSRQKAALNFVLYTMGGSVFMLIGMLVLFDAVPGHSFSIPMMAEGARALPEGTQILIFLGFLIGFGVKMPIVPLHGWLPLAHVDAPAPVSILLSGVLLKMGSYGLLRISGLLPSAVETLQLFLVVLAMVSVVYGGLLAWRQRDLKGMIAYSSVSHMGVVLLGIATLNQAGLTGAVMQMVAHGLVAGALFLLIGLLYERTHTRDIHRYSSLVRVTPRFAFFTTIAFVAAVGMPGTAGFVAELHALIGGFERWGWWVAVLSFGVVISATYAIRTVSQLFTGPVRPEMANIKDLHGSEFLVASVLIIGLILLGLFPSPLLSLSEATVVQFSAIFGGVG